MPLPETMRPSSDERLAGWIGVTIALTAAAVWINRRKRARMTDIANVPLVSEMAERIRRRPPYDGPSSAATIREDRERR
jgi:hypothetical protein